MSEASNKDHNEKIELNNHLCIHTEEKIFGCAVSNKGISEVSNKGIQKNY